ncbi:MAG: MCP four helix bundle domain-containing protein [Taibaiella sp.]|nr:MCP four helix bundle domain-containing protein [Taibaiella sp.]
MKWAYVIQYKLKAAAILLVIMATILAGNLYERKNFNTLDKSISAIYQDRLMPATYIYELSNHLYRKRLLQEHYTEYNQEQLQLKVAEHDAAINSLLQDYEKTYLTEEESIHWTALKSALYNYNRQYDIALANIRREAPGLNNRQLAHDFNKTMAELDVLSKIQAGVGHKIEKDSHAIVTSSVLPAYFENSMLVILGIICVVLFSVTDNRILQQAQRSSLN